MSTKKSEEFKGHALHVTQMDNFELVVPQADERPQTVWDMYAAAEAETSKSKKTTKQSSVDAAPAEQEK
jgi:hypothetical protein